MVKIPFYTVRRAERNTSCPNSWVRGSPSGEDVKKPWQLYHLLENQQPMPREELSIETWADAGEEALWKATRDSDNHGWRDLRFTDIDYLLRPNPNEPQRSTYCTRYRKARSRRYRARGQRRPPECPELYHRLNRERSGVDQHGVGGQITSEIERRGGFVTHSTGEAL